MAGKTTKTFDLYRWMMIASFILALFGGYVLLIGYGVPLPNITAQVPGAALSAENLPPGAYC